MAPSQTIQFAASGVWNRKFQVSLIVIVCLLLAFFAKFALPPVEVDDPLEPVFRGQKISFWLEGLRRKNRGLDYPDSIRDVTVKMVVEGSHPDGKKYLVQMLRHEQSEMYRRTYNFLTSNGLPNLLGTKLSNRQELAILAIQALGDDINPIYIEIELLKSGGNNLEREAARRALRNVPSFTHIEFEWK